VPGTDQMRVPDTWTYDLAHHPGGSPASGWPKSQTPSGKIRSSMSCCSSISEARRCHRTGTFRVLLCICHLLDNIRHQVPATFRHTHDANETTGDRDCRRVKERAEKAAVHDE
jgi:hypothetical protein